MNQHITTKHNTWQIKQNYITFVHKDSRLLKKKIGITNLKVKNVLGIFDFIC